MVSERFYWMVTPEVYNISIVVIILIQGIVLISIVS